MSSSSSYGCPNDVNINIFYSGDKIAGPNNVIEIGATKSFTLGLSGIPSDACWGSESEIRIDYPDDKIKLKLDGNYYAPNTMKTKAQLIDPYDPYGRLKPFTIEALDTPSASLNDVVIIAKGTPKVIAGSSSTYHTHGEVSKTLNLTVYRITIDVMEKPLDEPWQEPEDKGTREIGGPSLSSSGQSKIIPSYRLWSHNENAIRAVVEPQDLGDKVRNSVPGSLDSTFSGLVVEDFSSGAPGVTKPKWKKIISQVGPGTIVVATIHLNGGSSAEVTYLSGTQTPAEIIIRTLAPVLPTCSSDSGGECGDGFCSISDNPIRYHNGQIQMVVDDLTLIDGAFTYSLSRKYNNLASVQNSGFLGTGWQMTKIPRTVQCPTFWRAEFAENDAVHFSLTPDGSGNYTALQNYPDVMYVDAVNKTVKVTRRDQSVWTFNNDPTKSIPIGSLMSVVAVDGNTTEFVYDASKRLFKVQAYHNSLPSRILGALEYTWDVSSRITTVLLKKWNGSVLQSAKRVTYTYHTGSDSFGNANNLRTAVTEITNNGSTWSTGETYYYRYYKPGDPKGAAHKLKMAFFPSEFKYFSTTFGSPACFSTADATALNYSTKYYEYDSFNRVVLEKVDRNTKTIGFTYTGYPYVENHNAVNCKTVETDHLGAQNVVFANFKGEVLLKEQKPPQGVNEASAIYYRVFNTDGKETHRYSPKAVTSYSVSTVTSTTLNVVLSSNEGLIDITEYNIDKNVYREIVKRGNSGTSVTKTQRTYEKRQVGMRAVWNVSALTQYEDEAMTKSNVTQYAYTYHTNSLQFEQKITTYPVVPTTQNGNNVAATQVDRYDISGRLIWSKNEVGIISYRQYNTAGLLVKDIQDANTSQTSDFTVAVPSGWATTAGAGKHLVTEYEYDIAGRVVQILGPKNAAINDSNVAIEVRPASWTVYDDANFTVRSAAGFATMSGNTITGYTLVNPVSITIRNAEGLVVEQIQATKASTSGKLLTTDTFAQASYTSRMKNIYQGSRLITTRQYHLIPSSGDGAKNTNYLETTFAYDTYGRQNKTTSPDGTITKVDFDWRNNVIKTWVGTTDLNLVVVNETEYGDAGVCSTCTGTKSKPRLTVQYVDAATMRITEFGYDWRGRQIYTFGEQDAGGDLTYMKQTYDNLDRVTKSEQFLLTVNSGSAQPTGKGRAVVLQNNLADDRLLARLENFFDPRSQVWKVEQSVVNPATGAVTGKLVGQFWYDAAGRVTKQIEPGANQFTENVYDSLGRVTRSSVILGTTVFTQSDLTYDNSGNVLLSAQAERLSTAASGAGALTTSTGRFQYAASWYDGVGRTIATANYGTNNGVALTRPAAVPARSDTILVTETKYDTATGRAFRSIDPANKDHRTFYDHLGRTTKTVANYTGSGVVSSSTPDQNVTVEMTYHPSGQIATLTAVNPTTGNQVTKYVYGTEKSWLTPLVYRNDWLAAEIYPDSDDTESGSSLANGPDGVADRVEFEYNRAGEVIAKRDQNGTVHNYEFDNLGRLLHDRITTLASGVDGAVRRISTAYDFVGNVKSVTSYDNATVGSGNVVNQVLYEYDTNGLLSKDYSNPSGSVNVASTPYIGYTYDVTKSGDNFTKRLRPLTMKYPSGKTLTYTYGTSGSNDDLLARLAEIKEGSTSLVQYAYNGIVTPMKTTYPQPGLALDYTVSTALDRFDRIIDHAWKKSATDLVRIQHGYDRMANRLYRKDMASTTNSELYTYDGVNQIKSLNRGTLNPTNDGITGSTFTETWTYDMTGNWVGYSSSGGGGPRTYSKANEIQILSPYTCTHDKNGNMTFSPSMQCKYDAWNRLVELRNYSAVLLATYSYNGLNHRVKKTLSSTVTTSFFNSNWQELESVTSGTTSVYIWGKRYVDDLVLREKGAEKLYSLADPNWNVAALANASGSVVERIKYDAFGKVTWMNASFGTLSVSAYDWNRTFTGQVRDSELGLILYRNRYYNTQYGRFITRDPIGYDAGDSNLYRYVGNMPHGKRDPIGLQQRDSVPSHVNSMCWQLIRKYVRRALLGGQLRNRIEDIENGVEDVSWIFDHPHVRDVMQQQVFDIKTLVCNPNSKGAEEARSRSRDKKIKLYFDNALAEGANPYPCRCIGKVFGTSDLLYELKQIKQVEGTACCYDVKILWTFSDKIDWKSYGEFAPPDTWLARLGMLYEGTADIIFDQVMGANFEVSGKKTENRRICCGKH